MTIEEEERIKVGPSYLNTQKRLSIDSLNGFIPARIEYQALSLDKGSFYHVMALATLPCLFKP